MKQATGKVFLIGAGPGDPDLITVKGLACVKGRRDHFTTTSQTTCFLIQRRLDAELIYVGKRVGGTRFPGRDKCTDRQEGTRGEGCCPS